ncbi:LSU ribosomal protein L29P [Methanothermus fervidus DSM 2088]|uniref:Large ribosomal subunit protein uL29 n=1 Tax=Methanothermus fervidus (strain ATCC 43054 / DSM 2088 / JCM 10308 / V24 S) TaxID=523846 RepID=E3GZC5_METFV|nr:LSU ribosomal protein L29P [Methanothermus fervidus DSM 2088]
MAILKPDELREMSVKELEKKLEELRAEYSKEESKAAASGAPDNPGRMRELRRTIARILTIINEKKT